MTTALTTFLFGAGCGLLAGIPIGRSRAEWGRGIDEAKSAIKRRASYRK